MILGFLLDQVISVDIGLRSLKSIENVLLGISLMLKTSGIFSINYLKSSVVFWLPLLENSGSTFNTIFYCPGCILSWDHTIQV